MLLCLLATACGGVGSTPAAGPPPPGARPGEFLQRSIDMGAEARSYRLFVPSTYEPRRPAPLVVMLHGCIQDAADLAAGTRMNEVAEEHGFLVAYPEQPATANPQRCWNWYLPEHQQRDRGEPAAIAAITRAVATEFRVHPRRVYVAGISAGGAMSVIMAAAYPELFAAAGSHSGVGYAFARTLEEGLRTMRGEVRAADHHADRLREAIGARGRPVPLIVFHGDADPVVSPANAEAIVSQWNATRSHGSRAGRPAAAQVREDSTPDGTRYRVVIGREGGSSATEWWTVHGLGHAWSGGAPGGSFADPRGPDASREMIRFFRAHPRR
jgi:poly(hydroxyalkanoate) depolymerase family esterase